MTESDTVINLLEHLNARRSQKIDDFISRFRARPQPWSETFKAIRAIEEYYGCDKHNSK